MYKIIITDDHPLFRSALTQALTLNFPDANTYEASCIISLEKTLSANKDADLLILDLHIPHAQGFEGLAYLNQKYSQLPIIMISADEAPSIAVSSKRHGAMGFIPKSANFSQISEAIKSVLAGNKWFPNIDEDDLLLSNETDQLIEKVSILTSKQLETFNLLARGLLNKQIAFQMSVTEATVKAHLTSIMKKLRVSNRTEVILIANKINRIQFPH